MTESYTEGIRTQFVRDRLKETRWGRRGYIECLKLLEKWHAAGGHRGFAAGMWYSAMKRDYPVEDRCIKREIQEGVYTPPEEFRRLVAEWKAEQRRKKAEERRLRLERARQEREWLREERRKWLEAGGRP